MKIAEYIQTIRGHTKTDLRHLHGDKFYDAWDDIYGLFNTKLLQLGRYALSIQNSETEINMVSRNTTYPKHDIYAQTSGVFHFYPEKTGGLEEDIPLQSFDQVSSTPCFLGQGGLNPFLKSLPPLPTLTYTNDKARTDHSGQPPIFSVPVDQAVDRCFCKAEALGSSPSRHMSGAADRLDYNLLCSPSRESSPAEAPGGYRHQDHPL